MRASPSDGGPSFPGITRKSFKRSLFGYRPTDVDEALAARDAALAESAAALAERVGQSELRRARVVQLELVCDELSERVVARQRELALVRAELERMRVEGESGMRSLVALTTEIENVRRQARGQATRIRLRALRDAAELSERVTELARGGGPGRERLLDSLQQAIARIGAEDEEEDEAVVVASNGRPAAAPDDVFEGMVEVEVGPLEDFSQLVGFEDAAGGITATSEISVKRFAAGRATLEMKLAEPVELLRELEERAPFDFNVRTRRFDRLVLDVDDEGADLDVEAA